MSALLLVLLSQTYSGVDMRQNGTAIGRARYVNCTTNMTCWVDGGVGFVTSTGGGGGGAPTTAQYWVGAADGTLSAEKDLSALATGLVVNTAGTPSAYAGSTCSANQYATQTSASGALTCSQVATSQLSGTISNAQLASSYSGVGSCGANQFVTVANANAAPTCAQASYSGLSGTVPAYATVQDEGSSLTQRQTVNFIGASISCADNAGASRTDCTVSGGGGGISYAEAAAAVMAGF